MPPSPLIFLVGPRACGKTSLGRRLAKRLGHEFLDTDELVVERAGMSIAELVAANGWDVFRDAESKALELACAPAPDARGRVVATGGGMVLRQENRSRMREAGRVVYLKAPLETLAARLHRSPIPGQRPALTDKSAEDELRHVLAEREALYQAAAHLVLDATASFPVLIVKLCAALDNETDA